LCLQAGKAPAKPETHSRRSQREALSTLTAEEKLERRKERARMYSHIARKRQESNLRELKAEVESLTVYRLMVEEAPDMVVVLSPDIESRFLFVNSVFARVLNVTAANLLGRCVCLPPAHLPCPF
jgi:PAS domain-containing protein